MDGTDKALKKQNKVLKAIIYKKKKTGKATLSQYGCLLKRGEYQKTHKPAT